MLSFDIDLGNVESHRDEIVWRIVTTGVLPEQRTLAVDVVAEAFLDRLLIALDRGSYLELLTWLDSTCEFHAGSPQIGSMLASAPRAILATLAARGNSSQRLSAQLVSLEQSIAGIAFKPRKRVVRNGALEVDEVGRLIHDLLAKV